MGIGLVINNFVFFCRPQCVAQINERYVGLGRHSLAQHIEPGRAGGMGQAVGQKFGVDTVRIGSNQHVQFNALSGKFGLPLGEVIGNKSGRISRERHQAPVLFDDIVVAIAQKKPTLFAHHYLFGQGRLFQAPQLPATVYVEQRISEAKVLFVIRIKLLHKAPDVRKMQFRASVPLVFSALKLLRKPQNLIESWE